MLKTYPCYNGMEENETVVDYSRRKLTKVPQEVIVRGRVLEELYLDSNSIEILPKGVYVNLPNLRILSASDNNLCKLSTFIGNLDCLEKLDVSKNCISSFPDTIGKCTQLTQVDGSVNPIAKLPDGLMSLSSLTHLVLNETFLECLPEDFGRLSGLKVLELRQNDLHSLPKSINNLKELERLDIGDNKFLHLPVAIGYLTNLQELLADGNMIEEIPPVIGLLGKLTFLELSKNKLETLPPEMKALKSLTDLYLSVNELLELPDNIGSLSNLQTLKLDENDLIYLPFSIGRLQSLEELDVTTNNLEGLPCSIGQLKKLQVLTLDNNCIKSLPEELGNCNSLTLLSLHNNDLIAVPNTLGNLQNLQMINVSANMLTFLPLTFLGLKKLRALWLSENQSKPVVPLQKKYDEKKMEYVVSCHLLPQQSWEKDQTEDLDKEESDGTSNSSITEDKEDNIHGKESEVVRTSGSISQYFRQSKKDDGAVEGQGTPWYEQEFIESAEDCDVFPAEEENGKEYLSEEGSYNLNQRNIASAESYQSRHSFKKEQPSSLSELPREMSSSIERSCSDDQPIKMTSLESAGTDEGMPSFIKGPIASSSLLSSPPASSSLSLDTGAVGLSKGVGNHIDNNSLADAAADTSNDCVYGNTSASVSSPPVPDCTDEDNIQTDHSFALPASDDEKMRLRFNNKRHRNGNPLCQYEAFKPTRFNLYQDCNDLSWSTLAKDTPDASPMIKKKSVTSEDNPLIGARLARDESPPSRGGENQKYTTNPKYEEKIRVLQQQRLKERTRRRNNSTRVEYCGDSKFSKVLDAAPPPPYADMYGDRSNPSLVLPHAPPPYYVISDEGDSVAIQLSDFVLTSPSAQNGKPVDRRRTNPADKHVAVAAASSRVQHGESSPPVGANRLNDFVEQQPSESHYLNNTGDRYPIEKDGRVLRTSGLPNGVSGSKINGRNVSSSGGMAEVAKGRRINGNYYKDDNIDRTGDIAQRDDRNQSNKSDNVFSRNDNGASFTAQRSEDVRRGREENSGNYQNSPRSQVQEPNIRTRSSQSGSEQKRVTLRSDCTTDSSSTARPRAVKKLLLPQDETVQHVTVKSRKINRPVSPRVIMAVDGRNGNQDVAFKEFSSSCRVEDVTSFLVNNISEVTPMVTDQDDIDDTRATAQIIHEQVPVDCDIEDVTRNISKHLVEFCKVQNVESGKAGKLHEMKVQVTDLDMPYAACPLSRNVQNDENVKDKHRNVQVIPVPTGPKEEIEVRVYRSPILGFSIGGGMKTGTNMIEGVYVVAVNPDGPSSLLLKPGDRILEVNKLNLRSVSHEHAVLFLTHNQQLDLVIERVCQ